MSILLKSLTAHEAKTHFGDTLMKAQNGPVKITKNGKLAAVIMSADEFNLIEEFKKQYLHDRLTKGLKDIKVGNLVDEDDVFRSLIG